MKSKILVLFLLCFINLQAALKVASVLGDNMVLQRNTEVKIWGTANPNEKIKVITSWNNAPVSVVSNENGNWLAQVKTAEAGGPYTIQISAAKETITLSNILLGEVWLCSGQSNMEMNLIGMYNSPINNSSDFIVDADNDQIRLFTVRKNSISTPQDTCVGKWKISNSENAGGFSAVGYLFAKQLQEKLKVPVGLISSSWGGSRIEAWMSKPVLSEYPEALAQTTLERTPIHHKASQLYNGMIAPILNFAIKGAIWYQGESNIVNYTDYPALMEGMVRNWRKDFGVGEFPFYFVEIAPYSYDNSKAISSALLRESQFKAQALIPNSGMISTIDFGEEKNIHPAEKETVAKRLAYRAFSETYLIKGIPYKSPTYSSFAAQDSFAVLTFTNVLSGLTDFGKLVECFEVAGSDKVFYPAKIKIVKNQVAVWSSNVKNPIAVRYGFCNYPVTKGYLYNSSKLPLSSFRTDNWSN